MDPLGKPYQVSSTGAYRKVRLRRRPARVGRKKGGRSHPGRRVGIRICFLLLLFMVAQIVFFTSHIFKVSDVELHGNHRLSDDEVVKTLGNLRGQWLFFVSPSILESKLALLHEVDNVIVKVSIPGRIDVWIKERKPFLYASMSGERGTWYVVGTKGMVLHRGKPDSSMPKVVLSQPLIAGTPIDSKVIDIIKRLQETIPEVIPGRILFYYLDSRYEVTVKSYINNGLTAIRLGRWERFDYKLEVLKALLQRLHVDKKHAQIIDLRFSSPVVKFSDTAQHSGSALK